MFKVKYFEYFTHLPHSHLLNIEAVCSSEILASVCSTTWIHVTGGHNHNTLLVIHQVFLWCIFTSTLQCM
jgi:hypothetical protein